MAEEILFLAGTYEAQRLVNNYPKNKLKEFLVRHFLYSVLLADCVEIPIGSYYQSELMRYLTEKCYSFFWPDKNSPALTGYSIGLDKGSFQNDAKQKSLWFPPNYGDGGVYSDEVLMDECNRILTMQPMIRKGRMRNTLSAVIAEEISKEGTSFTVLERFLDDSEESLKILEPLHKITEEQKYAIVPEYARMEMGEYADNKSLYLFLAFVLHKSYAISCMETYDSYCNNPLSIFYNPLYRELYPFQIDYRDTLLFDTFLEIFPIKELKNIEHQCINAGKIWKIKSSGWFQQYLSIYKKIVGILKEKFDNIPLLDGQPYLALKNEIKAMSKDEHLLFHKKLVQDVNSSILLYKTLRYTLKKFRKGKKWLKGQDLSNFPLLEIESFFNQTPNPIMEEYIHNLFRESKTTYQIWRMNMKEKNVIKQNVISLFGLAHNEATIKMESSNKEVYIPQEEFESLSWNEIEQFFKEMQQQGVDVDTMSIIQNILFNGKYMSKDKYEASVQNWREYKENISDKILKKLQIAAQATTIATFILKLLGIVQ